MPENRISHSVVFYLLNDFSMFAFTMAIEPLRLANQMLGYECYSWRLVSTDGGSARASNGIKIPADNALKEERTLLQSEDRPTLVFVISGKEIGANEDKALSAWLRETYNRKAAVFGLYKGAAILAKSGLLSGKRCSIHWENIDSFRENNPEINVSANLYEIDDRIFTCAGGNAVMDMMMKYLLMEHGDGLVTQICNLALSNRIRSSQERQKLPIGVTNPKLLKILQLMEDNLCEILSHTEIANSVGLSRRQIERLFQIYIGRSPANHYLKLRLERARQFLRETSLPIVDVAVACGFVSASHFSKRYREHFGMTPLADRMTSALVIS
ncbi:MAG: GlxA family transcriptional regulator [Pseudomonadota bacterium]